MDRRCKNPAQGNTLIELTFALAILSVGILTLILSLASTQVLIVDNAEYAVAYDAARQKIEELRAHKPYTAIYADYSAGGSVGNAFTVASLPGTSQGLVSFPDQASPLVHVYEKTVDPELGMTGAGKDLDGDGTIDGADHSANYVLLPAKVTITWRGAPGTTRQIVVSTWIVDK